MSSPRRAQANKKKSSDQFKGKPYPIHWVVSSWDDPTLGIGPESQLGCLLTAAGAHATSVFKGSKFTCRCIP